MCGDGSVGDAKNALCNDPSDFEAIEVLHPHFSQDSLQCVLDLFRSTSAKENYLDLCRHEKEVPPCGMDLAIKGEAIQRLDQAPVPRAGLTLQSKELRHQGPVFH